MKKLVVPIAALALLLTLIASVNLAGANPLSAQSAPGLDGVRWILVSFRGADGSTTPALAGNPATAEFKDGRVSGSTGCNQYSASYQVGDNTFSIGQGIATKMACEPAYMTQEATFLELLSGVRGYWVQDGRLTLHGAQGAVVMTFEAEKAASLSDNSWRMTMYNNGMGGFQSGLAGVTVTATFGSDGRLTGSAGCNTYSAPYSLGGSGKITIGTAVSSKKACMQPIMAQEDAYLKALAKAATYELRGTQLTLRDERGAALVGFEMTQATTATKPGAISPTLPVTPTRPMTPTEPMTSTTAVSPTAPTSPSQPPARPALFTLDLSAGLALDPTFLSVQGGGTLDGKTFGSGCTGYVDEQPVVTVQFGGRADQLRAFFLSDADPTLVVQAPNGKVLCNDNATADILDPFVELPNPPAGEYRIYVGSAARNQLIPGILVLTTKATVDLGTFDVSKFVTRPLVPQVQAPPMLMKSAPSAKAAPAAGATARSQPGNMWRVDYYANTEWAGAPVITEYVAAAAYDWGFGSPSPYIPSDNFTVRLTTDVYFYPATYNFIMKVDDEFVLLIDGAVRMDTRGKGKSGQTLSLSVPIAEGYHRLEVLYREWTQRAYLDVNWTSTGGTPPPAQNLPPLPKSDATVQTKFGNFTACRQKGIHQANCFASDGAWNSPDLGSIKMEPQIQVWHPCEPADQVTAFYVSPQAPRKEYKCSKTLAGWFPQ